MLAIYWECTLPWSLLDVANDTLLEKVNFPVPFPKGTNYKQFLVRGGTLCVQPYLSAGNLSVLNVCKSFMHAITVQCTVLLIMFSLRQRKSERDNT